MIPLRVLSQTTAQTGMKCNIYIYRQESRAPIRTDLFSDYFPCRFRGIQLCCLSVTFTFTTLFTYNICILNITYLSLDLYGSIPPLKYVRKHKIFSIFIY